jgi:hypothetical protein
VSHTDGEARRLLFSDRFPRRADYSNFVIDIEIERQGLFISQGRNHVIKLTIGKLTTGVWPPTFGGRETVFDEIQNADVNTRTYARNLHIDGWMGIVIPERDWTCQARANLDC